MLGVVLRSTMVREHRARNHEKNHPRGQNSEQLAFHFPSSTIAKTGEARYFLDFAE